ncbi:MAG: hypothetical protein OXE43_03115 [Chloroflexi bacterium]|nr:hypothetical protein [Chloroflexota bacterium]
MGFLDKLFRRGPGGEAEGIHDDPVEQGECPHVALVPMWDNADDIGHEDKASRYDCGTCGSSFTPDEAHHLRETEAARIGALDA